MERTNVRNRFSDMDRLALILFYIYLAIVTGESATCPDPDQPENGAVVCSKGNKHMSTCKTECNSGYELEGPSIRLCWCKGIRCAWRGIESTCKETDCHFPTFDSGRLVIAEQWPGGFAALVNLVDIPARTKMDDGWTIGIVFDKPLGKNVSVSSWNMQLSATSFEGQTLTLINQRHNTNLQITDGQYNFIVVINNVKSVIPTLAYVGMFDRRIEDVSCLTAPKMTKITEIKTVEGSKILTGPLTIDESNPTTPGSASFTSKTMSTTVTTTTPAKTSTNSDKTTSIATSDIPSTTAKTESNASTVTTVPTTVQETSMEIPTGQYCRCHLYTNFLTFATTYDPKLNPRHAFVPKLGQTRTKVNSYSKLVSQPTISVQTEHGHYKGGKSWRDRDMSFFSANAALSVTEELEDWSAVFVFEHPITKIEVWSCRVADQSEDGLIWTFKPNPWVTKTEIGIFDMRFIATQKYQTVNIPEAQIYLCSSKFTTGDAIMTDPEDQQETEVTTTHDTPLHTLKPMPTMTTVLSTIPPTARCLKSSRSGVPVVRAGQTPLNYKANNDGTKYNYNELLHKSILFYEAQRSGPLPDDQRVPWRGDSGLKDGCDIGLDMTGGWYDAGDTVKFGFPMAFSLTTLSWGAIAFRDAYEDAGELENMINCVKWPTEYFIKAHVSKYELVGQVGHGQTDHDSWERPEMMTTRRPTYMITKEKPGTELAAETAAGLAAASIFLNDTHPELAQTALQHARELFEFADKYRGEYHKSILDASRFYKSYSGYNDELLWGAVWLYKASKIKTYLDFATDMYEKISGKYTIGKEFSWDQKIVGVQILLAQLTGGDSYRKPALKYIENVMRAKKTPQGMHYFLKWGSNRYAANAALMTIFGATLNPSPQRKNVYLKWAQKQIGLLLGDAGRSYVVGFGKNYPKKPHHKASSCSPYPSTCGWNQYHSPANNPYILYGALVGGPNHKGVYQDNRALYEESEVACDYNAGFQSAIAGLKHLAMKTRIKLQQSPMPAENITIATTSTTTTTTTVTKTREPVKRTKKAILQKKKQQGKICRPKRSPKCKAARKKKKSASG